MPRRRRRPRSRAPTAPTPAAISSDRPSVHREAPGDGGAVTGRRGHDQLAAEGREPVCDALQPGPITRSRRIEPPAVIADLEPELSRAVRQMDAGGARVRVL